MLINLCSRADPFISRNVPSSFSAILYVFKLLFLLMLFSCLGHTFVVLHFCVHIVSRFNNSLVFLLEEMHNVIHLKKLKQVSRMEFVFHIQAQLFHLDSQWTFSNILTVTGEEFWK